MLDKLNCFRSQMSHSTTQRSYLKDIQQLYRTIEKSTDGQASILSVNEMSVMISLHPKSGYNAHAAFTVKIKCPVSYPRDSPEVTFTSPIFHPNIDNNSGGICLNLLNEWLSCYSLLDVVKSLLYLIDNPNFDSANNSFAYLENRDLLAKKTMRVLAGLPVNGERYAPNKAWCEWAEAHGCLPVGEEEDDEENGEVPAVCVDVGQGSDDEDDGVSDVHASAYKDNGNGEFDGGAAVFDENVLSFANMRFVVASEKDSQDSPAFEREYTDGYFETQRILVWPPADSPNTKIPSVFYFFEPLGGDYYWMKFHDLYNTLFTGDVLHSMQNNRESRQSSSLCPWFNFIHLDHYSYQSSATSFFDLTFFFSKKMLTRPILTNDFCPWSHVDGGGIWGILGGLFCERRRRQRSWTDSTSAENSQKVDVSMHENRIPPWRASVGRLISDVYNFCERNGQMQNLILLDPMALSPLSPLLNLMRHSTEPKAHLIGVLWMTPIDALS
uniref:UBIQUITIN_CONJUGAT_2 domain-containing protein n=2 Tax=Mesocestoides corti TaxID=53468 RepID=A0A5K3FTG9_MESCO